MGWKNFSNEKGW